MLVRLHLTALLALIVGSPAAATDWPFWRYDAARSGASPAVLPAQLYLQWARDYPELEVAWPDQPKMQFDAAYEPIVAGKLLYVASAMTDTVTAIDTETGVERWRFHTDGPVRFAPLVWERKLYCAADDGFLYCVDAATGKLLWKFRGGPADRRVLGNERLISSWPARGAPVIADGTVYFAASIWPFMGVFIHALDARTGAVVWTNDGDGSMYMKQPHSADSFAGVAPQGPLAVAGDLLLVPGGRSVPACYDRKTGKFVRYVLSENGKRGGGSEVTAAGKYFFNGGAIFETATQKWCAEVGKQVVAAGDIAYVHNRGTVRALDLKNAGNRTTQSLDKKGALVKSTKWAVDTLAECKTPVVLEALIKAGPRLYGAGNGKIVALEFPELLPGQKQPATGEVVWQADIEGTAARLIAADGKLFAVTHEGRIYCFAASQAEPAITHVPLPPPLADGPWAKRVKALLDDTGARAGYAVAWGVGSGELVRQLLRQSQLHVIVVEADAQKAAQFKDAMIAAGLYGRRVAVHQGEPLTFALPPYFASLMVAERLDAGPVTARRLFQALRPFGGVAALPLPLPQAQQLAALAHSGELPGAKVSISAGTTFLQRVGPLPGSADWTHEHADASNTRVGKDTLVKAPLGILWWGGPEHHDILPRHGHGPQPQVIDGKLIIEGMDLLRCLDVYTGRILWETRLPSVGHFFNNLAHQPGANASGTNYISTSDGIYVAHGRRCVRLDPATGKIVSEFRLPPAADGSESQLWGYLNVVDDYLIGGAEPLFDPKNFKPLLDLKLSDDDDDKDKKPEEKKPDEKPDPKAPKATVIARGANDNLSASKRLVVMDRHTGRVLWTVSARSWFRHNATCVGNGRLYTIDRLSGVQLDRYKRLGEKPPHAPRLLAFDLKTGKELWSTEDGVFGTWLSFSAKHDVLVESGRNASDTLNDEAKGMRAYRAANGEEMWFSKSHVGPAMIHGETILKQLSACDLLTGKPTMRTDPITGLPVEWKWMRNYGCNTPAASEHLLTFRSGAAGYFDLCNDGGTGNFGGFKSGCTNNLIVAGGILNAPDYTRTCSCAYQNQTSLALIHMPEAEMWTSFGSSPVRDNVRRVGLNLGAPGDRKADTGTLWLEYPSVGGPSPNVTARVTGPSGTTLQYFRRHAAQHAGPLPWVGASGVKGLSTLTILRGADPVLLHALESLGQAFAPLPLGQAFVPGGLGQVGLSPFPLPTKPKKPEPDRVYTVRLYFSEPDAVKPGQRVFNVGIQGKAALSNFDVVKEAGGPHRTVVREFKGVKVGKELTVTFAPASGATLKTPLLSGIELVAEGW